MCIAFHECCLLLLSVVLDPRMRTLFFAQDGREGVEAEWEKTDEFHDLWKAKARDMLARAEWRRRKLTKRVHITAEPFSCLSDYHLSLPGSTICVPPRARRVDLTMIVHDCCMRSQADKDFRFWHTDVYRGAGVLAAAEGGDGAAGGGGGRDAQEAQGDARAHQKVGGDARKSGVRPRMACLQACTHTLAPMSPCPLMKLWWVLQSSDQPEC